MQKNKTFEGVTRVQWQALSKTVNTKANRDRDQPNMLLNIDMCLSHKFNVVDATGTIDCDARRRASDPNTCEESSTDAKAEFYANDENIATFITDFTKVFLKMGNFNYK